MPTSTYGKDVDITFTRMSFSFKIYSCKLKSSQFKEKYQVNTSGTWAGKTS